MFENFHKLELITCEDDAWLNGKNLQKCVAPENNVMHTFLLLGMSSRVKIETGLSLRGPLNADDSIFRGTARALLEGAVL